MATKRFSPNEFVSSLKSRKKPVFASSLFIDKMLRLKRSLATINRDKDPLHKSSPETLMMELVRSKAANARTPLIPYDLLTMGEHAPSSFLSVAESGGKKVWLRRHPSQWPPHLLEYYFSDLLTCFPTFFESDVAESDKYIACEDIRGCPEKKAKAQNENCPFFVNGCCSYATLEARDGEPLSFGGICVVAGRRRIGASRLSVASQEYLLRAMSKSEAFAEVRLPSKK